MRRGLISHLSLLESLSNAPEPAETVVVLDELSCSLTSAADIRSWSAQDPTLA